MYTTYMYPQFFLLNPHEVLSFITYDTAAWRGQSQAVLRQVLQGFSLPTSRGPVPTRH